VSGTTDDPADPRLTHGADAEPVEQAQVYLVLSAEERAAGFTRPYRDTYRHLTCGAVTRMSREIAETYARQPIGFYGATYCCACRRHRPVGAEGEFLWDDGSGERVGT
jgi:hypothetical protein